MTPTQAAKSRPRRNAEPHLVPCSLNAAPRKCAPADYKWELYHLTEDYTQYNDLGAKMPDKLKEMQKVFDQEAAKYNVLP